MHRTINNLPKLRNILLVLLLAIMVISLVIYLNKIFKPVAYEEMLLENEDVSVKIAILNGCGFPNIASEVKEYFLENHNGSIDVVGCRNIESCKFIYKKSLIVLKHDEIEKLEKVMKLTNIHRRIYALDDNCIEDIQIILGKDYTEYFSTK